VTTTPKPPVGWREWVGLPDLGVEAVKAKIDTGARSSTLHAFDVDEFTRNDTRWLRFVVHPLQLNDELTVACEAPLVDWRDIRSSNGDVELRPVIATAATLLGRRFGFELTLSRRDEMGFRMLVGRSAIRRRFVVDPGRSFLGGGTTLTPP
jgi:hypothetical protein